MNLKYTHHLFSNMFWFQDTRALVVREVFQVEKSYVESLQFLVIVSRFKKIKIWPGLDYQKSMYSCIIYASTHEVQLFNER